MKVGEINVRCRHKTGLKHETIEFIDCHNWLAVAKCSRCGAEVIVRSGVKYGKTPEVTNWHVVIRNKLAR